MAGSVNWTSKSPITFDFGEKTVLTAVDRNIKQNCRFCIVDVSSSKRVDGKRKEHKPTYSRRPEELERALDWLRTAQNSKKRLLSFVMIPKQVAVRCYSTTESSERLNLKEFFERHARYAKLPADNCNRIQNYWESEFHLSYYQLLRESKLISPSESHGIVTPESKPFPGDLGMSIVRASASFRFHGDFFDRHWTCYMLDSTHKGPITDPNLLKKRTHCQRKVLEQQYFADILRSLNRSAGEILYEVNRSLGVESGSFSTSIDTTNAYLSWAAIWQEFQPLIQKLHNDLDSTQPIVRRWEAREDDRGREKPRWTADDERKYRASIMTIRREIKNQISQLEEHHNTTKSLQDLCSNRLDKARENLRFRSEQNIATFTYVTVVFLPLGFTASIFSMNGSPEASLAIEVVIASVIALAVTILALTNAKGLAAALENIANSYEELTAKAKQSSVIIRDREKTEDKAIKLNHGDRKPPRLGTSSTGAFSWNLVFWAGYILIELPSRSITAACRTLGYLRNNDEDLEGLMESKHVGPFARSAVASGIRYCLVPSMALLDREAVAVSERPSMEFPDRPAVQLIASRKLRKGRNATKIARVLLGFITIPVFLPLWVLQILCFYAWDVLVLCGGTCPKIWPRRCGF